VYLEGLDRIMPKGVRNPEPGPVSVRMGDPVSLEGIEDVPQGTALLEDAMRALAAMPLQQRSALLPDASPP
jgi:hypothetical protein